MKKRSIFKIKYSINYPSGKKWIGTKEVVALTEYGAKEIIRWIYSSRDISIIEVCFMGYTGCLINEDRTVLGDF